MLLQIEGGPAYTLRAPCLPLLSSPAALLAKQLQVVLTESAHLALATPFARYALLLALVGAVVSVATGTSDTGSASFIQLLAGAAGFSISKVATVLIMASFQGEEEALAMAAIKAEGKRKV